jgi:hypothetical protein
MLIPARMEYMVPSHSRQLILRATSLVSVIICNVCPKVTRLSVAPQTILQGDIITKFAAPDTSTSSVFKHTDPYDSPLVPLPYTRQRLIFGVEAGCEQHYVFTAVILDASNTTSTIIVTHYEQKRSLYIPEEKPYKVSITHDVDPEYLVEIVYLRNAVSYAKGNSSRSGL